MLDGFQAGLSWTMILRKREAFRKAFRNFDPAKVARFGSEKTWPRLMADAGIVRLRAPKNRGDDRRAPRILRVDAGPRTRTSRPLPGTSWAASHSRTMARSRRGTPLSEEIVEGAQGKRGFKFVGPVHRVTRGCRAVGMVNDPRPAIVSVARKSRAVNIAGKPLNLALGRKVATGHKSPET